MANEHDVDDILNITEEPSMNEEDEEEAMTAPEVLQKLEEAWLNEKFAPDLLPVKSNLIECMLAQIDAMENNITLAKKGDFRISVHRMEIDRIRYVVSSYLRQRIAKIESFTSHVLQEEIKRRDTDSPLLSDAELEFAKGYHNDVMNHLRNTALNQMPSNTSVMNLQETTVLPNMDSYVFLKVNETTENVLVEEETTDAGEEMMDFQKGDQHLIRFKPVAALVESGAMSLI
ncbi:DNA replication complex GINS protein SLD5-like [Physella acuta]|uniref:DNA replication complex GINS protein SLD5-like n=1 Tax=Physella acuta TaxID=109671 RepID=UPI0027DB16E4|nr:DNA replication complex GINS protein SLD5-like [Physella acuta]XP_059157035.1 DNA replication complex GINS protein SLD5-like [Physella acuta]